MPNNISLDSPTATDGPRIERIPSVVRRAGLSRATIYARIKLGTFPKPIPLGERAVGFLASEVDEWIAAQVAAREANSR